MIPNVVPTTNREYTALVEAGVFPDCPVVPIDAPFINENGVIMNLLLEKFSSIALISSRAGSVRANHYHKTDWHYAFVLSGTIHYFWRPVGNQEKPQEMRFTTHSMFFTPPLVEHAMYFPEPTTFITFAKNIRDHKSHEADLVRVPLIATKWNPLAAQYELNIL